MNKNNWVIFGAGEAGIAAFVLLKDKISFFIDNDIEKQNYFIGGIPVISLEKAKNKLDGVTVILGTINPLTEEKMRGLLSNINIGSIFSFYELSHIVRCKEYDFSPILEKMWNGKQYSDFLYHIKVWVNNSSKAYIEPINKIYKKYLTKIGNRLVDVACGYGFWSLFFRNKGFDVLGIDNDSCRMKTYRDIGEEYSAINGMEADIREMNNISDESMDVAFCANTIHVIPEWRKVISEMVRITRPEGYVILIIADPTHLYIKRLYRDLVVMQWDATKENVIAETLSEMVLVESLGVYDMECITWSRMPTHYILVFQKNFA